MKSKIFTVFVLLMAMGLAQEVQPLEKLLTKEFPKGSNIDGRWVYEDDSNEIESVPSHLTELLSGQEFFKTTMVNYLGWHIESSECLIVFDQKKSKVILIEPVWYGGITKEFIQLFISQKFQSKKEIQKFVFALQDVLLIGSVNKSFRETSINDKSAVFKLYDKNDVWRNVEMTFNNGSFVGLISTNPKTKEKNVIE